MEALTGNNLIVTALVLVAVMEFVNLVGRTVGTFREWRKPGHDSDEDFQKRLLKCENRLEKDSLQLQDMKNGQKEICYGVQALLNHALHNGNSDEMKAASDNINKWLVDRN
jgi:hypothetical protein